ncbi:MAG: energy transducer TonB [Verrucomicrobiota bacterium]
MKLSRQGSGYQRPSYRNGLLIRVALTVLMALAIFALLPFTQYITALSQSDNTVRTVEVTLPPPPPPPPEPPPPEEETVEEPPPQMTPPPPPISLAALDLALNPGMGDAMAAAMQVGGFGVEPDAIQEMQIFSIAELDEKPRFLTGSPPQLPYSMQQARIPGRARIKILLDSDGRVIAANLVSSNHPDYGPMAIQTVKTWVFTAPTKDGEPVRAEYILPISSNIR